MKMQRTSWCSLGDERRLWSSEPLLQACHQTSNISRTFVGNKIVDHSDACSWSIACRRCSNYIFIRDLTPGFNGLGNDNRKTGRESFKFWDLVRLILGILRYFFWNPHMYNIHFWSSTLQQQYNASTYGDIKLTICLSTDNFWEQE